jgi:hypothetical protein
MSTPEQPNFQIIGSIALPCAVDDITAISQIFIRRAKKENRACYMRQQGDYMEFFTLPHHQKPQPPTTNTK